MNKIKRLLKIYPITKNWILISNYPVLKPLNWSGSCHYSDNNYKDISSIQEINPPAPLNIPQPLFLTRELRRCTHLEEIYSLMEMNFSKLKINEIIVAVRQICVLSQRQSIDNFASHPEFIQLFKMILKQLRTLNLDQVVEVLNIIHFFNLRNNSTFDELTQSLFQLVRHSVNDLNLVQIAILQQVLTRGNVKLTPLTEALSISLPIVFKANLRNKLDRENIYALHQTLKCICLSSMLIPQEDLDLIINSIYNCRHNITPKVAKSLLYSLVNMNYFPKRTSELILQLVYDILSDNMDLLTSFQASTLLRKISEQISIKREHMFYNEKFIERCIDRIIRTGSSLDVSIFALKYLNSIRYASMNLLDHTAIELSKIISSLDSTRYTTIAIFTLGLMIADYKPPEWNKILQTLIENQTIIQLSGPRRNLIRWASYLVTLDYYEPKLLAEIFGYHDSILPYLPDDLHRILYLYQCVKTMFPAYQGPWPPPELLERAHCFSQHAEKISLRPALERGLGGPQYIKHNIKTSLGHFIDHIIVMRKGGYPVAINFDNSNNNHNNGSTESLESIEYPLGSQIILIVNLPYQAYSINLKRLCRRSALFVRSIETLTGHAVVPINNHAWSRLSEQDKIPHLMQAIKSKCIDTIPSEDYL